jgi:hypothetical protein
MADPIFSSSTAADVGFPLTGAIFLEGAAGTGKTSEAVAYVRQLLTAGVAPERILVIVPQRTLGRVYQQTAYNAGTSGGVVDVTTLAGIAYESIARYWPLVATKAKFADPNREPKFLTIETAQYFMARLANPVYAAGQFEGVGVSPARVISQTFDNLNKAALLGESLDQVGKRLVTAWGDRQSSRLAAYHASLELAAQFRTYCLEHSLIDVSLGLDLFRGILRKNAKFKKAFFKRYTHLVFDNLEEDNFAAHDFTEWLLPHLQGALLVYDTDASYRVFLGADSETAYNLSRQCAIHEIRTRSLTTSAPIQALIGEFDRQIGSDFPAEAPESDEQTVAILPVNPLTAFEYKTATFFPQMIQWAIETIINLTSSGVPKREIAVVAPYLSDSLRFSLIYPLQQIGITTLSHRPSRALRDEPAARALITLARLAYPVRESLPPAADVADALGQSIGELDPVRARILTGQVYGTGRMLLKSFDELKTDMQSRVSYRIGEKYEQLRLWLNAQTTETTADSPLDHFWRRLFGEVLSQPGFGFHRDLEAGRIVAQMIESARTFRVTLYDEAPDESDSVVMDWSDARREYFQLIDQGLLAALAPQSWQDDAVDAVLLSPAITFLLRDRVVKHQIWLDVGSAAWSERLEQPLTHPYVLRRDWKSGEIWTDEHEHNARRERLHHVATGLLRRCQEKIYLGIADLGEEGFEQRGQLLDVFQRIVQRHTPPDPADPYQMMTGTP